MLFPDGLAVPLRRRQGFRAGPACGPRPRNFAGKRQRSIFLLRGIAAFASSAILLWLTWWGYDYLKYALRLQKETASLYLPWIYAEAAVFVSMFLMTLYTLLELRDMITLYRTTPASLPVEKEGD